MATKEPTPTREDIDRMRSLYRLILEAINADGRWRKEDKNDDDESEAKA